MNSFKPHTEQQVQAKKRRSFNLFRLLDPEQYIKTQAVLHHLPFVLFCGFLTLLYIANAHTVEKRIRKISRLETEMKDLRAEYISLKSELMHLSKQSEVAKRVEVAGLKELRSAPKKIFLNR